MAALFYLCGNCSALTFRAWSLVCSDPSLIYSLVLSFLLAKYSMLIYKSLKLTKVITIIFWYKLGIHKLLKGHDGSRKKCDPTPNLSSINQKAEVPCAQAYGTGSHSQFLFFPFISGIGKVARFGKELSCSVLENAAFDSIPHSSGSEIWEADTIPHELCSADESLSCAGLPRGSAAVGLSWGTGPVLPSSASDRNGEKQIV